MIRVAFFDAKEYDVRSFEGTEHDGIEFKFFDSRLSEDTVQLADGYDAVCVFVNDIVDGKIIDCLMAHNVKLIALRCAGYNNVDIEYAYGRLHIVRVPSYSPNAVAEHAMALLLTSIRRIHKAYNRTREFNFSLNGLSGFNLQGKTIGVIGTGKIGRAFINICKGFGMHILAYDIYRSDIEGVRYVPLEKIWAESDIISLHCPLTDESRHMINPDTIAKMKKGVIIVNTSRGALVDSEALLAGIKTRKIGGACLDVYEEESNVFFHDFSGHIVEDDTLARLISMPNVIVTSHQGFLTEEALKNIAETTIGNIREFIEKGTSENEICYKCSDYPVCNAKEKNGKCF